jgi:two-component system response regulator YesN
MYKVVVADDEHRVKISVRSVIESEDCGFQIIGEASDGLEALELLSRIPADVLITDIRMPGIDGLELIRTLRERNNRCEIVILSGYNDFNYAQEAIRHGATSYLLKPVDPDLLLEALADIRNQFHGTQKQIAEETVWIQRCGEVAHKTAELLWQLKELEAEMEIDAFVTLQLDSETDPIAIREKSLRFLTLVDSELARRLGDQAADGQSRLAKIEGFQDARSFLLAWTQEVTELIKLSRNFGQSKLIDKALSYIETRYTDESLSLDEVAGVLRLSPTYLSYVFKQASGVSFLQHITKMRMEQAKQLLDDLHFKVYEVGQAVGYTDYAHFAKAFKKYCDLTPTEYRKRR